MEEKKGSQNPSAQTCQAILLVIVQASARTHPQEWVALAEINTYPDVPMYPCIPRHDPCMPLYTHQLPLHYAKTCINFCSSSRCSPTAQQAAISLSKPLSDMHAMFPPTQMLSLALTHGYDTVGKGHLAFRYPTCHKISSFGK